MCTTCGCSNSGEDLRSLAPGEKGVLRLEQEILSRNNRVAVRNRAFLARRRILALNMLSSPGAGKTTIIESMLRDLQGRMEFSVIVGDQETDLDASRLRVSCPRVVQLNTGRGCHLDARMVESALEELKPPSRSVVIIENVGNLVCPALFDLGETMKVVISSVTEGEDKPLKYPHVFRASQIMLLNKMDILPHLPFDVETCISRARQVNPRLQILPLSARRGEGLGSWYTCLQECIPP